MDWVDRGVKGGFFGAFLSSSAALFPLSLSLLLAPFSLPFSSGTMALSSSPSSSGSFFPFFPAAFDDDFPLASAFLFFTTVLLVEPAFLEAVASSFSSLTFVSMFFSASLSSPSELSRDDLPSSMLSSLFSSWSLLEPRPDPFNFLLLVFGSAPSIVSPFVFAGTDLKFLRDRVEDLFPLLSLSLSSSFSSSATSASLSPDPSSAFSSSAASSISSSSPSSNSDTMRLLLDEDLAGVLDLETPLVLALALAPTAFEPALALPPLRDDVAASLFFFFSSS
mmetsp:Transcript_36160/g.108238  ORF Transcript_36160/g.108238 Transcript_36160/m.108238 type:complete len:279 (-) Transcript_36160:3060-3896(-)